MHHLYPWQQQEWQNLLNRKVRGQLPHAVLIKGMEGLGKHHFARCFAELLLCQNPSTKACGECSACQLLQSNGHPDLIIIQPEEQSKSIKIDQIREVAIELNNTSQQGGYKIVIIDHAELLNITAANALLKTLEEPAPNVIIILVTNHPAALTATILSRCQTITMRMPSYIQAQEWLKQKVPDVDPKDINSELVLALAENAPLKALKIVKEGGLDKRRDFFQHLYALKNKKMSTVQIAEQYLNWDLRDLLMTYMSVVSDIVKIKLNAIENIINQDQAKELTQLATKMHLHDLFAFQTQLLKAHQYLLRNINFNQQLAIENLVISWEQLFVERRFL